MSKTSTDPRHPYSGSHLDRIAFPMGGIGAGMICLEGTGAFSHVSLRHQMEFFNEPNMFAALHVKGAPAARVLEGPVPGWKRFGGNGSANGHHGKAYGLPRFREATFESRFPFATVSLRDRSMPVRVDVTGWSPFIPGNADDSSLPFAAVEYRIRNTTARRLQTVFSFHAANFVASGQSVATPVEGGFAFRSSWPRRSGYLADWQIANAPSNVTSVTSAPCVRLSDPLNWKPQPARSDGFINAHEDRRFHRGIVYLGSSLNLTRGGRWTFHMGHDGGMRLYVDGREVATDASEKHPALVERTHVEVDIPAGDHEIMVAFDPCNGAAWGLILRLSPPAELAALDENTLLGSRRIGDNTVLTAFTTRPGARADCGWFQGGWFDSLSMLWNKVASGGSAAVPAFPDGANFPGASFYLPITLGPRKDVTIPVLLAWYKPDSDIRAGSEGPCGPDCGCDSGASSTASRTYVPWYASRFPNAPAAFAYWRAEYARLRTESARFADCFHDTTLPPEAVEAAAANLAILKSPTCLRQADGRFWAWEGCYDNAGCCHGSCTHVWNYAQAIPHLFPELERSLRETEFTVSQDTRGHQNFRSSLPIRQPDHGFHAAADGQLGGIIKVYREWRIGGDTAWMRRLWPAVRQSLDYCIASWDPDRRGAIIEPHHNTYDIEFWGPDGMCTSFYLGALRAAIEMGRAAGENVVDYEELLSRGCAFMEQELFNGDYFIQKVQWKGLHAADPSARADDSAAGKLLRAEGPKYQYGTGCLSDGILGAWMSEMCGLPVDLDAAKVRRHLVAIHRYNLKRHLWDHVNPQRPSYALAEEGGLLLCTWPKGGQPSLPFVYSNEVWTGIEHQVASHLILAGEVEKGLEVVRTCRARYDGRVRNPFNEYECGHFYARAMASYGLLQSLSGARYDAVDKVLHLQPRVRGDFRAFLSTATGYGTVGVKRGKPFFTVASGSVDIREIRYRPAARNRPTR